MSVYDIECVLCLIKSPNVNCNTRVDASVEIIIECNEAMSANHKSEANAIRQLNITSTDQYNLY